MKSKQKTMGTVIIMLVIVIAVAIGFWKIMENKRGQAQEEEFVQSDNKEVNAIMKKDFDVNYPSTPREVLKNYNRIVTCVYNHYLSDEEVKALAEQMRKLFDDELLAANPLNEQLEDLKADIDEYHKAKKIISNYVIDKDSSIAEKKVDGKECASVMVSYLINEGKGYTKTYQKFLLRKDENKKWKILGWKLSGNEESKEEE